MRRHNFFFFFNRDSVDDAALIIANIPQTSSLVSSIFGSINRRRVVATHFGIRPFVDERGEKRTEKPSTADKQKADIVYAM